MLGAVAICDGPEHFSVVQDIRLPHDLAAFGNGPPHIQLLVVMENRQPRPRGPPGTQGGAHGEEFKGFKGFKEFEEFKEFVVREIHSRRDKATPDLTRTTATATIRP